MCKNRVFGVRLPGHTARPPRTFSASRFRTFGYPASDHHAFKPPPSILSPKVKPFMSTRPTPTHLFYRHHTGGGSFRHDNNDLRRQSLAWKSVRKLRPPHSWNAAGPSLITSSINCLNGGHARIWTGDQMARFLDLHVDHENVIWYLRDTALKPCSHLDACRNGEPVNNFFSQTRTPVAPLAIDLDIAGGSHPQHMAALGTVLDVVARSWLSSIL